MRSIRLLAVTSFIVAASCGGETPPPHVGLIDVHYAVDTSELRTNISPGHHPLIIAPPRTRLIIDMIAVVAPRSPSAVRVRLVASRPSAEGHCWDTANTFLSLWEHTAEPLAGGMSGGVPETGLIFIHVPEFVVSPGSDALEISLELREDYDAAGQLLEQSEVAVLPAETAENLRSWYASHNLLSTLLGRQTRPCATSR